MQAAPRIDALRDEGAAVFGKANGMKRKPISKRLRFEIFKRDAFTCVHCGATPNDGPLHLDHLKPLSEGGADDESNLVTACVSCNLGKGPVPLGKVKLRKGKATEAHREHAEQLREWLAIQQEVAAAKSEVRGVLEREWETRLGYVPTGVGSRLERAVAEFGMPRVCEAVDIVAERVGGRSETHQLKYFYGVLRKWRGVDEAAPPEPEEIEEARLPPLSDNAVRAFKRAKAALDEVRTWRGRDKIPAAEWRGHVLKAFYSGALGEADDASWIEGDGWRHDRHECRGIVLAFDPKGGFCVQDEAGFNPHKYAWDELRLAAQCACYPHEDMEEAENERRALEEKTRELWVWLAVFTKNGDYEWVMKQERFADLRKLWGLE